MEVAKYSKPWCERVDSCGKEDVPKYNVSTRVSEHLYLSTGLLAFEAGLAGCGSRGIARKFQPFHHALSDHSV
jgi:hypothetical protein